MGGFPHPKPPGAAPPSFVLGRKKVVLGFGAELKKPDWGVGGGKRFVRNWGKINKLRKTPWDLGGKGAIPGKGHVRSDGVPGIKAVLGGGGGVVLVFEPPPKRFFLRFWGGFGGFFGNAAPKSIPMDAIVPKDRGRHSGADP